MFNQLINLYKRGSTKTPLEDFTTEAFVGILKLEPEIKQAFISDFLKLPESDYTLKTQVRYDLPNDRNCIIDFVIEGDDIICFIENKVNSKEGDRQLERYSKVLNGYGKETKLYYCTKYHDPKEETTHDFEQIRWFQIGKFLTQFSDNNTVKDFLTFLKKHKMSQELTITAQDFITFDNLQKTINLVNEYLDRVKPIFQENFGKVANVKDGKNMKQLLQFNRLAYYVENIMDESNYSEMLYCFRFDEPRISVHVYMNKGKGNEMYALFLEEMEKHGKEFDLDIQDHGASVSIKKDISVFLNTVDGDSEIAQWFKATFQSFHDLMLATPSLNWKI
jgi:hypothetical protein